MAMSSAILGNKIAARVASAAQGGVSIPGVVNTQMQQFWQGIAEDIIAEVMKAQIQVSGVQTGGNIVSGIIIG